ncbi:MAG: pyridoxine 5'-phosphate synthase [Sandaracinaceae bacterium]|nr:MAG: pyridoxine 5'-phosphate synthase [Sandaracinaceae bacterium]HBQ15221.1 pyridoxine 5'-phosphate synthase [Myxococcales bacterium]
MSVRLHVNVDHVATLRQARGTAYPDPVEAAVFCEHAGADGITVHLREDRRHIQERDVHLLRQLVKTTLNLEMAATDAMVGFALDVKPDLVTLVPEKREEQTTEGGLDVAGQVERMAQVKARFDDASIPVSLFIDPDEAQVRAAVELGADSIELHTGDYCAAKDEDALEHELLRLTAAAALAEQLSPEMTVAAGHGLTSRNLGELVASIPQLEELNIGHALIADAVFLGLKGAVEAYLEAIELGEAER